MTVAALYVERGGVYWGLEDVDAWDVERDARTYDGPWPVVAHPPCGPWSLLRHMRTKQDPSCGPRAFEQVRRWGGVLEHPAHSRLFAHVGAPGPWVGVDAYGGRTYHVNQVAWGHPCTKPTWIYVVGLEREIVEARILKGGRATHRITSGGAANLPTASRMRRMRTPPAFRDWLIGIARMSALCTLSSRETT